MSASVYGIFSDNLVNSNVNFIKVKSVDEIRKTGKVTKLMFDLTNKLSYKITRDII